ncbi:MAG: hypothetical protein ACI9J2_001788 [Saprospiraceae bacterium]|jgi:hypothetical protein
MKTRKKLKHDDQNASLNSTDGGGNKQQTRPAREHTTTQTIASLTTVPATTSSITTRLVDISSSGNQQHIRSNGIAEHLTGAFPNSATRIEYQNKLTRTQHRQILCTKQEAYPGLHGVMFSALRLMAFRSIRVLVNGI